MREKTVSKGKFSFVIEGLLKNEITNSEKHASSSLEYSKLLKVTEKLIQVVEEYKMQIFRTMSYLANREDITIITQTDSDVSTIVTKLWRIKQDVESLYHYSGDMLQNLDRYIETFSSIKRTIESDAMLTTVVNTDSKKKDTVKLRKVRTAGVR